MDILATQSYTFLICLLTGVLLNVVYGVFSYVREVFNNRKSTTFILDMVYGILAIFACYIVTRYFCKGVLYFYNVCGILLGFYLVNLIYTRFLQKFIIIAGDKTASFFKKFRSSKFGKILFK